MKLIGKYTRKGMAICLSGTLMAITMITASAAPREVVVKHWTPDLIGGTRDENIEAVGHNCGTPAKDGYGNIIGWEAIQDPNNQDGMFNHMVYGCETELSAGDYYFDVRMKVDNVDETFSNRYFNIDIYCANHASFLGNLSVTHSVIDSVEVDQDGYAIYRLPFEVDATHDNELLEGRVHFSNKCDAVITDCYYIKLDSSVQMNDISIPLDKTVVKENAVLKDGKIITDPSKPGYVSSGYNISTLPEGQLYGKVVFGLGSVLDEMKNSDNVFRMEVLDVSGTEPKEVKSMIFTGKAFKFENGDRWTPDRLYTLIMPFKVEENMVGKNLEMRLYSYGVGTGRQAPISYTIHHLLISDDAEPFDDPNKPVEPEPEVYIFNEQTVTGDPLKPNTDYWVYDAADTAFENAVNFINTDENGAFELQTGIGFFVLIEDGTDSSQRIYLTVDGPDTANFSNPDIQWNDTDIYQIPAEFDPHILSGGNPVQTGNRATQQKTAGHLPAGNMNAAVINSESITPLTAVAWWSVGTVILLGAGITAVFIWRKCRKDAQSVGEEA